MDILSRVTLRQWATLAYRDPRTDLINLGRLQGAMERTGHKPMLSDLRNHQFKGHLENRQAALFAHLVSALLLREPVEYVMHEHEDYDCILRWKVQHRTCYQAVQLKEIVPKSLNRMSEIDTELQKLSKYVGSEKTIAAFHLNQSGLVDFSNMKKPKTSISAIWLYGALTPNQSQWFLYGDVLKRPVLRETSYPR